MSNLRFFVVNVLEIVIFFFINLDHHRGQFHCEAIHFICIFLQIFLSCNTYHLGEKNEKVISLRYKLQRIKRDVIVFFFLCA